MSAQKSITITTDDLMSVAKAAQKLGKHFTTIYRWVDNGDLVSVSFSGIMFIPTSEVERIMEKNRQATEKAVA